MNEGDHLIIPMRCWPIHTTGGSATGPMFASGTAVLFVDSYVLPAGLLGRLT